MRPINLEDHRARREAKNSGKVPLSLPRADLIRVLQSYLREMREAVDGLPIGDLARAAEEILRARACGKTVYILGNGGSAATAVHAVADWRKPHHDDDRGAVRTASLVDNVALLTAWANDTSFDNVFAAQLDALLTPGDVVIAISGSGNSPNVLRAVETARRRSAITIGLIGSKGGALANLVDISVVVPSADAPIIEDLHMTIVHALRTALRQSAPAELEEAVDANETLAV